MKKSNKSNSRSEFLFNRNLPNSKRSQSHVVSVTLMIFIVIVVAGIVYTFSLNYIKDKKAETQGQSFYYDAELYVLEDLASLQGSGGEELETFQLGVKKIDNEQNITGVRFIFENDHGGSDTYDDYITPPNNAGVIESYYINSTEAGINFSQTTKISLMLLYGNNKATKVLDEVEI